MSPVSHRNVRRRNRSVLRSQHDKRATFARLHTRFPWGMSHFRDTMRRSICAPCVTVVQESTKRLSDWMLLEITGRTPLHETFSAFRTSVLARLTRHSFANSVLPLTNKLPETFNRVTHSTDLHSRLPCTCACRDDLTTPST